MDYPNGNETKGETGKQYCVQYLVSEDISFFVNQVFAGGGPCSPTYFGLGTTSIDYSAGRSGGFGDIQGYVAEGNKYYAKTTFNRKIKIPNNLVKEVINQHGVKILRVVGSNQKRQETEDEALYPILGTPGEGRLGAIINLKNQAEYSGVVVEMNLDGRLNESLFDNILSTFKYYD